jgi:hypothetical protein
MAEDRGGLHRERFAKLQIEFDELVKLGAAGPDDFRVIAMRLLRAFETTRLKNHDQIDKLKQEVAFCEATSRACDMFENLLLGLVEAHKNDRKKGLQAAVTPDGSVIVTDTDLLKTICACGCRDEEDAQTCDCPCHQGLPCGKSNCVVCTAKQTSTQAISDIPAETPKKSRKKKA